MESHATLCFGNLKRKKKKKKKKEESSLLNYYHDLFESMSFSTETKQHAFISNGV